ncbi:adenylate kinase/ump-cmp kinase family and p-loop containing nucleoside triphosphate hydrolase domain-containing protein [Plakobranchus ocellatus]|uniref:Adenylate kinase/ump-cmp kinase family and p-loop containing nucleoside triphosphate hydrolase domain-containing protein n=1 Tax=Plakobranchus ocellatus TaxID=259542 RepID=A0AAV3Y7I2_9GAST|nr:adenylate kinase/ump-cmp kinase family and p-loop containing nucleoside triphosphate hydrolase domain-containing protein [Plakobranchus ocellatus]
MEVVSYFQDDPTTVSLTWILKEVTSAVDKNTSGRFLVDMMPNLKYIIRTANFAQDCSSSMAAFEEKYPISFSLYFSLKMNSNGKSPKPEEVKEDNEETDGGFQSDEVDLSRTKRRASMFENSVRSFLEYFEQSERLMTVDVSCRNADAISSRVCELFSKLNLRNQKMVNTVFVFTFDKKLIDPELLEENDVDYIRLEKPGTRLSIQSLDDAIRGFVNRLTHTEHKTIVLDLSATNITKHTEAEVSKSSIVFVNDANMENYFDVPGCQGMFKTVSSLENAVCVFPSDTNPDLCKKIAISFNNEFSNSRAKGDSGKG